MELAEAGGRRPAGASPQRRRLANQLLKVSLRHVL